MSNENLLQREAKMMKLERLIAEREGVSDKPFPVPVKELLHRYEQLYTGAINDVLREFCLLAQALPHDIVPLRDRDTVASSRGWTRPCGATWSTHSAGRREWISCGHWKWTAHRWKKRCSLKNITSGRPPCGFA
jgi:hypothetical protein